EVAERLEIRVTKAPELGAARLEIELRGGGSEIHRQRMERVRDAAVAPVEEDVPPTGEENLPIVEVVVLDRLGDPAACRVPARRSGRRRAPGRAPRTRGAPRARPPARQASDLARAQLGPREADRAARRAAHRGRRARAARRRTASRRAAARRSGAARAPSAEG